jgi:hypothetical protein
VQLRKAPQASSPYTVYSPATHSAKLLNNCRFTIKGVNFKLTIHPEREK